MAQPPEYTPTFRFADFQAAAPQDPLPGNHLDVQLQAVAIVLSAIIENLGKIQRDDGRLANLSVGFEQLRHELTLGFNPPSVWEPDTAYTARDMVFDDGKLYLAVEAHTSTALFEPAKWTELADLTSLAGFVSPSAGVANHLIGANSDGSLNEYKDFLRTFAPTLHAVADTGPGFRARLSAMPGSDGSRFVCQAGDNTALEHLNSAGNALIDITPRPAASSAASIRLFRSANTTGACRLELMRGDNTTTVVGAFEVDKAKNRLRYIGDLDVQAGGVSEWRSVQERLAEVVNVKDYGAKGDGSTNDTSAVQAALNAAVAAGKALYFPAGAYVLMAQLTAANAPITICGDGMGVSRLVWPSGASTRGISISVNSATQAVHVRDLAFLTGGTAGTAITFNASGQIGGGGVIVNRTSPRLTLDNVWLKGSTGPFTDGWDVGVDVVSAMHVIGRGLRFEGRINGAEPDYASTAGVRFSGSGAPVEFLVTDSWIFYAHTGVDAEGCEGVLVTGCHIIGCANGVVSKDDSLRPHLLVSDSHINATAACVVADGIAQAMVTGSLLYCSILADDAVSGVLIKGGARWFNVTDCQFENTSSTEDFNCVVVEDGEDGLIDANVFRTGTTAIWLTSGAERVRVGVNNVYGTLTNARIVNSGSGNVLSSNALAGSANVASGTVVNFGFTFQSAPIVTLTHVGTATNLGFAVSDITTTGFTLRHSNDATPTVFGWVAVGL